jgi:hypothetical protein
MGLHETKQVVQRLEMHGVAGAQVLDTAGQTTSPTLASA